MSSKTRVIICTGAPGNGRDEILEEMHERTAFHYHHLFDDIVDEARLEGTILAKINILDFYDSQPGKMEEYREKAIEKIANKIKENNGLHIISTPYHFEWRGNKFQGLNSADADMLNPDMFLIIFDDIIRVKERLEQDPQWRYHKLTLGEIANWRREEMSGIYNLAHKYSPRKEVQIVAYSNKADFLRDLILNPKKLKFYLSHPITGEEKDFFHKVTKFAESLSEYYIAYDPYLIRDWDIVENWRSILNEAIEKNKPYPEVVSMDIDYPEGKRTYVLNSVEVESAIKNLRFQIIDNDYKIIENSDLLVVYHPRKSISAGVMCEMVYAKALAKMVYAYYPYEPSPFFEWYTTRIFSDENDLRNFLIKETKITGQTPLDFYSDKDTIV
jgi:adenylate kinase